MKQKKAGAEKSFARQIIVYLCSFLIVAAVVGSAVAIKKAADRKAYEEELKKQEEALKEDLEEVQTAMSQDEMEDLFDQVQTPKDIEQEEEVEIPIDFASLQELNPDVYAWISVPGTDIDYPILQHPTDNTYYLNYNIDGSYGYPGCIYTENLNAKDFSDPNTVIYGHNMKNGTMFAQLHKFEDPDFFEEHQEILIYTPEEILDYTIFAAYVYDDRHLLYNFDFSDPDVYERYLNDIFAIRDMSANIRTDMEVTKEDKIITLATCMSEQPEKRLLVQAVLNRESEEAQESEEVSEQVQ